MTTNLAPTNTDPTADSSTEEEGSEQLATLLLMDGSIFQLGAPWPPMPGQPRPEPYVVSKITFVGGDQSAMLEPVYEVMGIPNPGTQLAALNLVAFSRIQARMVVRVDGAMPASLWQRRMTEGLEGDLGEEDIEEPADPSCARCSTPLNEGDAFCAACGLAVATAPAPAPAPPPSAPAFSAGLPQ